MKWIVQAQAVRIGEGGWRCSVQIPTFFLDPDIQGFSTVPDDAQVEKVARSIIDPFHVCEAVHVSVAQEET
jgi:hypothetical protein